MLFSLIKKNFYICSRTGIIEYYNSRKYSIKVLVGQMENITYKRIEFKGKLLHFGVGFNLGFDLNFNINIELYKST